MIPSTLCCIAKATSSGLATPLSHISSLVCDRIHGIAVCHSIVASANDESEASKRNAYLTYHIQVLRLQQSNSAIEVPQAARICSYARLISVLVPVHLQRGIWLCIPQLCFLSVRG
jgi:hypothetical protein